MITISRISTESLSTSRLPLIEMETAIPDIRRPAGLSDSGDSQTSTLRNTTRPTRGFRRPFRRFFRQDGSNGMARSDFMNLAAGKSSSSLAGKSWQQVSYVYTS